MKREEGSATSEILERLMTEMGAANQALLRFDGASFARHVENEIELLGSLPSPFVRDTISIRRADGLEQVLREHKILLRQTKRTVSALQGLLQATHDTYEVPISSFR